MQSPSTPIRMNDLQVEENIAPSSSPASPLSRYTFLTPGEIVQERETTTTQTTNSAAMKQKHILSSPAEDTTKRQHRAYLETNLPTITTEQVRQNSHVASGLKAARDAKLEAIEVLAKLETKKEAIDELISKQDAELQTVEQDIKTRFSQNPGRDSGIDIGNDRPSVLDGLHSTLEKTARDYLNGAKCTRDNIQHDSETLAREIHNAKEKQIETEERHHTAKERKEGLERMMVLVERAREAQAQLRKAQQEQKLALGMIEGDNWEETVGILKDLGWNEFEHVDK